MNTVMCSGALIELATVTATGEAASFPASRIKDQQPGRRLRLTNLASAEIVLSLSTALPALGLASWRMLPLLYHTMSSAATWDILGASSLSALSSTPTTIASGLPPWRSSDWVLSGYPGNTAGVPLRRHTWFWSSTPRTETYVKIRINDATNAAGFVEVGCIPINYGYQPTLPIQSKPLAGYGQEVRRLITLSGAKHPQPMPNLFGLEFTMQVNGAASAVAGTSLEAELLGNLLEIERSRGTSGSVFVVLDPAATTYTAAKCAYGLLDAQPPIALGDPWHLVEARFRVETML